MGQHSKLCKLCVRLCVTSSRWSAVVLAREPLSTHSAISLPCSVAHRSGCIGNNPEGFASEQTCTIPADGVSLLLQGTCCPMTRSAVRAAEMFVLPPHQPCSPRTQQLNNPAMPKCMEQCHEALQSGHRYLLSRDKTYPRSCTRRQQMRVSPRSVIDAKLARHAILTLSKYGSPADHLPCFSRHIFTC